MIGAIVGAFIYKFFVGLHGGRDTLVSKLRSLEGFTGLKYRIEPDGPTNFIIYSERDE